MPRGWARAVAIAFSPGMVLRVREAARREGATGVVPHVADGMARPLADGAVDAAFCMRLRAKWGSGPLDVPMTANLALGRR